MLLNGSTTNFCFENRQVGFVVRFTGEETLHGTYGGPDGLPANRGDELAYGFFSIPVFPQRPLIIQYMSGTPVRSEPVDGFRILNFEFFHPILGAGVAQGIIRGTPIGELNNYAPH